MPLGSVLALALSLSSVDAPASTDIPLRDYVHTTWTQHNGEPLGAILSIFQSPDGYLWLVTRNGLLKFDGMQFTAVPTPCREKLGVATSAPDGSVWILCGEQLLRRTPQGRFVEFHEPMLRQPRYAVWLLVDQLSRPWLVGESIRRLEADGTGGENFARPTAETINTAALDARGTLWVADPDEVVHIGNGQTERFAVKQVLSLTRSADGGMYAGNASLVWHLRDQVAPQPISAPPGVTFANIEGSIREAPGGELWLGTRQSGIAVLRHDRIETFSDIGDRDRLISEVFIDREGTIWAAASSALHRFRRPMVEILPAASNNLSGLPGFVFVDSRGSTWVSPGTHGAHSLSADGKLAYAVAPLPTARLTAAKLPNQDWVAIGEDETGRIWLSNTRQLGYVVNRQFVSVNDAAGHAITDVWMFTRDPHGNLWAIAEGIGVYQLTPGIPRLVINSSDANNRLLVSDRSGVWVALQSGGVQQYLNGGTKVFRDPTVDRADSIPRTIVEDGDAIWIGTFRGLKRWRNGVWTTWTREHGLPGDGVLEAIVPDRFGRLWLMTAGGLLMLPREPLDATPDGQPGPLTFARIGLLDGVSPHPGGMRTWPRAAIDEGGRLYFTTMDTVVTINPSSVTTSSLAPPIVLETAAVDNRPIDSATAQSFVEPSQVEFDYTSLSLRSPENARFRYRLEGRDSDWVEAGSQRHVTYGNLKPGSYRFRVIGAGSEGVWNQAGAAFAFEIAPVYWRRWWFRLSLLAGVVAVYRVRMRVVERHQREISGLNERLMGAQEQERIRLAGELHDSVMQEMLAATMMLGVVKRRMTSEPGTRATIDQVQDKLVQVGSNLRQLSHDLHPPVLQDMGLPDALRAHCDHFSESCGVPISCDADDQTKDLSRGAALALFRIVQEALGNAAKHAKASQIQVRLLRSRETVSLTVSDDGVGFERAGLTHSGGLGLISMRERATQLNGRFEFNSVPGRGTTITITIPFR